MHAPYAQRPNNNAQTSSSHHASYYHPSSSETGYEAPILQHPSHCLRRQPRTLQSTLRPLQPYSRKTLRTQHNTPFKRWSMQRLQPKQRGMPDIHPFGIIPTHSTQQVPHMNRHITHRQALANNLPSTLQCWRCKHYMAQHSTKPMEPKGTHCHTCRDIRVAKHCSGFIYRLRFTKPSSLYTARLI